MQERASTGLSAWCVLQEKVDHAKIELVLNEVVQLERTGDIFGKVCDVRPG